MRWKSARCSVESGQTDEETYASCGIWTNDLAFHGLFLYQVSYWSKANYELESHFIERLWVDLIIPLQLTKSTDLTDFECVEICQQLNSRKLGYGIVFVSVCFLFENFC